MPNSLSTSGLRGRPTGVVSSVSARHGVGTVAAPVESVLRGVGSGMGRLAGATMTLVGPALDGWGAGAWVGGGSRFTGVGSRVGARLWPAPTPPAWEPVEVDSAGYETPSGTAFSDVSAVLCQGKWLAEWNVFSLWTMEVSEGEVADGTIRFGAVGDSAPANTALMTGSLPAIVSSGGEVAVVATGQGTGTDDLDRVLVQYWGTWTVMEANVAGRVCTFAVPAFDPWGGLYAVFTAYDPTVATVEPEDRSQDTNPTRAIQVAFWTRSALENGEDATYVVELVSESTDYWHHFPSIAIASGTEPDATLMVVWRRFHLDGVEIVSTIESLAVPITRYGPYCDRG